MRQMSPHPERDPRWLLAEEPFVRDLAKQLLVSDADEVVQQTWLRAAQQGGGGIERPRHWLARVARNVIANLRRGDRRRREREQAVASRELVPSSAALAEREERRRMLVAAVDTLPPPLRTVVLLRWFDGHPPRRIAEALGVPVTTVSSQLHRALALLRERLDAAHGGDRRAWLVQLVPFVVRPPLPPSLLPLPTAAAAGAPAILFGAIAMTTKSKLAVGAAVMLIVAGAWMLTDLGAPGATPPTVVDTTRAEPARAALGEHADAAQVPATATAREAATPPAAVATSGSVIVHVRYGDDHAPAIGMMMTLQRSGADPRYDGWRQRTDDAGTARYEAVPPGRFYVSNEMSPGKRVDVVAGQPSETVLELDVGIAVTGIVVDDAHRPVAGAAVEVTMMARSDSFPEAMAVTGTDGRFAVRACPNTCLVGARASGFTASPVKFLHGKKGNTAEVELVLGKDGGAIEGTVVDANGKPVTDATVIAGAGKLSGIPGQDHIPPFPALTRSDAEGHFRAIGVPLGEQPVKVRAPGFAPWQGTCEITSGATAPQHIVLTTGGVIRGNVRNSEGKPVDRAEIEIGELDDLSHCRTLTRSDGSYELDGLPLGELRLRAEHDDFGKASQSVRTAADAPTSCDLQLSRGLVLQGRVVDPQGQPVSDGFVECMADSGGGWFTFAKVDAKGVFTAANCPETGTIRMTIRASGFAELTQRGIDPHTQDLQLQLQRLERRSVRIVARVVGPDGMPVANASVDARREDARDSTGLQATDNDGRLELGPLAPGVWKLNVRSAEHPEFDSEARTLAADSTWDLGTITMARGGTARLRLLGPAIPSAQFYVISPTRTWTVADEAGGRRTSVLAAGDYSVLVFGNGVAAQSVPFTIRTGEQIVVDVTLAAGISQRFQCELPADVRDYVRLQVRRGDAFVARAWTNSASSERTAEVWLAPGDYTVTAECGALRGSATFTVGAASGPPVSVTLH
jgi:RNA polymerase sigma-70 factor (ECF subfamily)